MSEAAEQLGNELTGKSYPRIAHRDPRHPFADLLGIGAPTPGEFLPGETLAIHAVMQQVTLTRVDLIGY